MSKEFPSTSTEVVSAYTNTKDSAVNSINPTEIFNNKSTLQKGSNRLDGSLSIL